MMRLQAALLALFVAACGQRVVPDAPDIPSVDTPVEPVTQIAGLVTWGYWLGSLLWLLGVLLFVASLVIGFFNPAAAVMLGRGRSVVAGLAAGGLALIVASWLLDVWAVISGWLGVLILVGSIVTAIAFAWGHRKALEKWLKIDLDRDGRIGDGARKE